MVFLEANNIKPISLSFWIGSEHYGQSVSGFHQDYYNVIQNIFVNKVKKYSLHNDIIVWI